MQKWIRFLALPLAFVAIVLASPGLVVSQVGPEALENCKDLAFSTEEDFAGKDTIISDGDLLGLAQTPEGISCAICARNADLLLEFNVRNDLGLDAADVIADVEGYLVAFSTELDSTTPGQFTAGDLLVTNGVIILNTALTAAWEVPYDLGLDAVHFVGEPEAILAFLRAITPHEPVDGPMLDELFAAFPIDILFSTEGTWSPVELPGFLDGDLLSAAGGFIVAGNDILLHPDVPAGIPVRGVDFGLDAVTGDRLRQEEPTFYFSTEILHNGKLSFTDGDVLLQGDGIMATNWDLVGCFEPRAQELGLDALSLGVPSEPVCVSRIDRIGGVDVADISPSDGMVVSGTLSILAPQPFGGRIDFQGNICDDVDEFRIVYRKLGSGDPWKGMDVPGSKNWQVRVDAPFPPWSDCDEKQSWSSDGDGWFDANDYLHLSHPLYGCNPDLSLTVWDSTVATGGPDELYEVVLETRTPSGTISDTARLVQLDNTWPQVELEKVWGVCDEYADEDMPLMVTGRMSDTHFYKYQVTLCGDGYPCHPYPQVAYYDSGTDNIIETGTNNWDAYVDLRTVDVFDLVTAPEEPVKCGYAVVLTGWDRTLWCWFTYPSNHISRCSGCIWSTDTWTFDYVPTP